MGLWQVFPKGKLISCFSLLRRSCQGLVTDSVHIFLKAKGSQIVDDLHSVVLKISHLLFSLNVVQVASSNDLQLAFKS